MSLLSGPQLNKLKAEVEEWYFSMRQRLIAELEAEYAYGHVPLTPDQQLERAQSMTPEDWQEVTQNLANKYRGMPNQEELVKKDIQDFITHISRLALNRGIA